MWVSSSANGLLSSSDLGLIRLNRVTSQPSDSRVIHLAPVRIRLSESQR
ncbi:hypothetical protein GALL_510990 [mine drainage metagenome]|uniref:Uncharacterized protein n=1 Tax=mine drainage metagenome TaxID=410659 RepID=A0A1J5P7Y4_9ZZZZ